MDQTKLQQQIALYYSKLSPSMQTMFSSMKWMDTLSDISKKYGLTEEQKATLGTETTLVLLGMIDADEYEKNIAGEVAIPAESMTKMMTEIDESILKSIRPELTTTFQKNALELVEKTYGTKEKLDERFNKLPKEVQEAISESGYQKALYTIASKHNLTIDEMGALEEATTKVMLSLIHPDKYESELQSNINKPKEEIAELAKDVNEGVLKNIREILKSHWGGKEDSSSMDDEVPIPPYKKVGNEVKIEKTQTEATIYEKAGIEMVNKNEPVIHPPSMATESNKMMMKEDVLFMESGIDMLSDKLNRATVGKSVISDHSLPKMESKIPDNKPTENTSSKAHDPYHEPIEI